MRSLIFILLMTPMIVGACPKGAPSGYEVSKDVKGRSYHDHAKTVSLTVMCDTRINGGEAIKALTILGEPQQVDSEISFVDLGKERTVSRIYMRTGVDVTQVAVIAKTPEALEKAAPAIVDYLKSK